MCLQGRAHGIRSDRDDQVRIYLGTWVVLSSQPPSLYDPSFCPFENLERDIERGGRAPIWFGDYHSSVHPWWPMAMVAVLASFWVSSVFSGVRERAKSDSFSEQIRPRTVDKKTRGEREREREEDRPTDTTTKNRPPAFVRKKTGLSHLVFRVQSNRGAIF